MFIIGQYYWVNKYFRGPWDNGRNRIGSIPLIHNERFRELFFEGDYLFYLQALKKDIPKNDGPGTSVPWNAKTLYWPIPNAEYDYNPELTKP